MIDKRNYSHPGQVQDRSHSKTPLRSGIRLQILKIKNFLDLKPQTTLKGVFPA